MKYGLIILGSAILSGCYSDKPIVTPADLVINLYEKDIYNNSSREMNIHNHLGDIIYDYTDSDGDGEFEDKIAYVYSYEFDNDKRIIKKSYESKGKEHYFVDIFYKYSKEGLMKKIWEKDKVIVRSQVNEFKEGHLISSKFYGKSQENPYKVLSGFNRYGNNPTSDIRLNDEGNIKYEIVNKYNNTGLLTSSTGGYLDSTITYRLGKADTISYSHGIKGTVKYGSNGIDFTKFWDSNNDGKVDKTTRAEYIGNTFIRNLDHYKNRDII